MDKKKWEKTGKDALGGAVLVAAEEFTRRKFREWGQRKLQDRVNKEAPAPIKTDLTVEEAPIPLTLIDGGVVDLQHCQEVPMDKDEVGRWKALISTYGGETLKAALNTMSFDGLLKCDVPLRDLCQSKYTPNAMRGFVMIDGRISQQASFEEVKIANAAPLLVFQCMAAVTSQYYQQIITERLNVISEKLDRIMDLLEAEDRARLKVAYDRLVELSQKTSYDVADKQFASECSADVDKIKEKYRVLLSKITIETLKGKYKWSDKKEAENKIETLEKSRYFIYLDIAMQAEVLSFIATAVSIKIAEYLGNDEDKRKYANRINFDCWDEYINQFNSVKHDVVKYLEYEADASWMQSKSIRTMKDHQLKNFNAKEKEIRDCLNRLNCRTVQYVKVQKSGELKKYISLQN